LGSPAFTARLFRLCERHAALHRFLDGLCDRAEAQGQSALVRTHAHRLLERAHVERLRGESGEGQETAEAALDRFERLADQGDVEAAWMVAEAHRSGFGRPRNHWKAIERYELAASLGHPEAADRARRMKEGEELPFGDFHALGRAALLRATYRPEGGGERVRKAWHWVLEAHRDGTGWRGPALCLGVVLCLVGYLGLDIYFFGMGAWRPDPSRVVWGLFGKIHPPREREVGRVLPGWMRPDVRSVAFHMTDCTGTRSGSFTLGDYQGKVVYVQVVDGRHPMVGESRTFFRNLYLRSDIVYVHLFLLGLEAENGLTAQFQMATDIVMAFPEGSKAVRPLGNMTLFPMNFVLDRHGRVRQKWAGWSQELSEAALRDALAEAP
jgi:hypothetical protein